MLALLILRIAVAREQAVEIFCDGPSHQNGAVLFPLARAAKPPQPFCGNTDAAGPPEVAKHSGGAYNCQEAALGGLRFRDLLTVQEIDGALRVGGGLEDEPLVILQNGEPGGDVGGVIIADLGRQFQIGAQERRSQFRDEFLVGIGFVAPGLAAEVAGEAGWVPGPVATMPMSA